MNGSQDATAPSKNEKKRRQQPVMKANCRCLPSTLNGGKKGLRFNINMRSGRGFQDEDG